MPTHTSRNDRGMTLRALQSAMQQSLEPASYNVYTDVHQRGAPYARQHALEMNREPWTAFLDSDDTFMPNHLEVLAKAQIETGADYVYSWFELVRLGQRLGDVDPVFPPTHFSEPWDKNNPRQTTMTVLVRTDLAREVGFWDVSDDKRFKDGHRVGEDWEFTLKCNELGTIYHVPQRTWYWHHHGQNTSGRATQGDAV